MTKQLYLDAAPLSTAQTANGLFSEYSANAAAQTEKREKRSASGKKAGSACAYDENISASPSRVVAALEVAPLFAPFVRPAFAVELIIGDVVFPAVALEEIAPDGGGDRNDEPVQRPQQQALDGVPVFVDAGVIGPLRRFSLRHKNKQSGGEPAELPRQIGDIGVMEFFVATLFI